MQIAGTRVIAQSGPERHHFFRGRCGQRRHIRKFFQKTGVIRNHRRHLCLLQHDLREPDTVGITRLLPGQLMTSMLFLPLDQGGRKRFISLGEMFVGDALHEGLALAARAVKR